MTAKPINDALKEQNKEMEEVVAKSGVPAEASIMQQIINQNNEFVARNNELINANKDANGNSPAWDLVAGVAQAQQQQPAAPMKGPYLLATPEKKQNTDASVSNKQSAGTATAPETPSGQPMYLNMLLGK